MNERIRELLKEATEIHDDWKTRISRPVVDYKVFAELIVQECLDIVANAVDHREPASTYVGKIKEHFGVKEQS